MSFFQRTFHSILGIANSDDQPANCCRKIPSAPGGLSLISSTSDIESTPNFLESIAVKPTLIAGNDEEENSGDTAVTGGAGYSRPSVTVGSTGRSVNRFATWTESLGFESSGEKVKGSDTTENSPSPARSATGSRFRNTLQRPRREKVSLKIFPPLLSSLKENGRPRFNLRKVMRDGRLQIVKVPNDRPEVIRTPRGDGRLRIHLIDADEYQDNVDEEEEEEVFDCVDVREEDDGGDRRVVVANGNGSGWRDGGDGDSSL